MGQSKVSDHMRKLKDAGLVREEKRGKWAFYSLDRENAGGLLGEAADRLLSVPRSGAWPVAAAESGTGPGAVPVHPQLREESDGGGSARDLGGDRFEAFSAGTEATYVGRWPSGLWTRSAWTSRGRSPRPSTATSRSPSTT